jgi:acetylglutamate kinase
MITKVVISKHWHQPEIAFGFDADGVRLTIPVEDFAKALAAELGAEPMTFKQRMHGASSDDLLRAVRQAVEKLKQASTQARAL